MKWNYNGKADITIGEKSTLLFKVLISLLVLAIVISTGVIYYFREDIIDYFVKPEIKLVQKELEIEVTKEFNAKDYILNPYELEVEYPTLKTDKIGEHTLVYKVKDKEYLLKVKVVDNIKPTLELSKDLIVITDGDKIEPKDYLKNYSDNYDKKEDLEVIYPTVDYNKKESELLYKVKDKSNNETIGKIQLVIKEKQKEPEVIERVIERPSSPSSPQPSQPSRPSPSRPSSPYIAGTRNHTISLETTTSQLANILASGVSGSGFISINYSSVNLSKAGTYNVTYNSSDGVSKTVKVTVR